MIKKLKQHKKFLIVFVIVWVIVAIFVSFSLVNRPKYDYENLTEQQIIEILDGGHLWFSSFSHSGEKSGVGIKYADYDYDRVELSFKKMNGILPVLSTKAVTGQKIQFHINSEFKNATTKIVLISPDSEIDYIETNKDEFINIDSAVEGIYIFKLIAIDEQGKIEISRSLG